MYWHHCPLHVVYGCDYNHRDSRLCPSSVCLVELGWNGGGRMLRQHSLLVGSFGKGELNHAETRDVLLTLALGHKHHY